MPNNLQLGTLKKGTTWNPRGGCTKANMTWNIMGLYMVRPDCRELSTPPGRMWARDHLLPRPLQNAPGALGEEGEVLREKSLCWTQSCPSLAEARVKLQLATARFLDLHPLTWSLKGPLDAANIETPEVEAILACFGKVLFSCLSNLWFNEIQLPVAAKLPLSMTQQQSRSSICRSDTAPAALPRFARSAPPRCLILTWRRLGDVQTSACGITSCNCSRPCSNNVMTCYEFNITHQPLTRLPQSNIFTSTDFSQLGFIRRSEALTILISLSFSSKLASSKPLSAFASKSESLCSAKTCQNMPNYNIIRTLWVTVTYLCSLLSWPCCRQGEAIVKSQRLPNCQSISVLEIECCSTPRWVPTSCLQVLGTWTCDIVGSWLNPNKF